VSKVRIARFVDMEACRSIFSDYSTYVLRSSEYYKRHYETDRGDEHELEVRCAGGGATTSGFLLSCWTMLKGDEPTRDEWRIFPDSVVAIVSTPKRVSLFLKRAFEIENRKMRGARRSHFLFLKHKAVTYADEVAEKITWRNITDKTVFTKRSKFTKQNEYRFALAYSMVPHLIDTYILALTSDDYLERCFANPGICDEQKRTLLHILLCATAGNGFFCNKKLYEIIANVDALFSKGGLRTCPGEGRAARPRIRR
jgi:hypothetical protein